MSVKVASNRFIVPSIVKSTAFYQQINTNVFEFHKLGEWLSSYAENLQAFRQTEKLKTVAEVLSNLPLQEYRLKGQYYLAWCGYRSGQDMRSDFELIVERSEAFRDKGLLSLAGLEIARKDYATAMKYYEEAIKRAKSPTTLVSAARSIAIYKADQNNHKQALRDLQTLYPLVRYAQPKAQLDYLNSYAVELGEAGRIEEARNICRIILASPYAFAYPEWRETEQGLAIRGYKSRSSVPIIKTIPRISGNVSFISERERSESRRSPFDYPRGVSTLADWKKKMVKEPNGNGEESEDMTPQEIAMKIVEMITQNKGDEENLRKLMDYARKIFSK